MNVEKKKHSLALLRERLNLTQAGLATRAEVSLTTVQRAEAGKSISPEYRQLLCNFFSERLKKEVGPEELGLLKENQNESQSSTPMSMNVDTNVILEGAEGSNIVWQSTMQDLFKIFQQILASQGVEMDTARRRFLEAFGLVGASMFLSGVGSTDFKDQVTRAVLKPSMIDEQILNRFDRLTNLCWRLLKGNDLVSVEDILVEYMPKLQALVEQPSQYQKVLARYTAQSHILMGLVAGHRDNLSEKLKYCDSAIQYSQLAEDPNFEVTALIQKAVAFDYRKQHDKSQLVYRQALLHANEVTPLLRARIYAGLGGSYARCGQQEKDAFHCIELAAQSMPIAPEQDPSFLFADCGRFTVPLWEGRVFSEFDQLENAYITFARSSEDPSGIPERIRTEFLNHMLETSIAQGDLDKSLLHLRIAGKAAVGLNSDRRQREVREASQTMLTIWRTERKRIRDVEQEIFQ